jgi:hypothetical protein
LRNKSTSIFFNVNEKLDGEKDEYDIGERSIPSKLEGEKYFSGVL